jgi:phage tail-like protein
MTTGTRHDPFMAFRFEVRIDDLAVAGFSECGGIQLETELQDYAEGGLNTHLHKFASRTRQANISLKRGIADRVLWDWYYDITRGLIRRRNGSIRVRAEDGGQVLIEWQFQRAFPLKWVGPDLNALQNSVAIETFELCHEGLERRI